MSKCNVNHVEIPSRDPEESGKFYHELFGWEITPIPGMNYSVWETEGSRGGFVALNKDVAADNVQIYINSDDVSADLKKADALGARILQTETEIPGRGWFGVFKDPTGNKIGLFKRKLNR
jgi:predicted enzyme related to lactoylglutathione lyase